MISVQVYDSPTRRRLLADLSGQNVGVRFSTNRRGFSSLATGVVALPSSSLYAAYEWPGTPHVIATDEGGGTVWEGRLEDISVVADGFSMTAFGYQRVMSDLLYTGLWSVTGTGDWRQDTDPIRLPDKFTADNNNRLYIALKSGVQYDHDSGYGELVYYLPHQGVRDITTFTADYTMLLPSGFETRIMTAGINGDTRSTRETLTGTGSLQSGSVTATATGSNRQQLRVSLRNYSGASYTNTAAEGTYYVRLTNIRLKTVADPALVLASTITKSLIDYVSGVNPGQLSATTALVQATDVDLLDEIYEDARPSTILDDLALRHQFVWSVWEGQQLQFQPRASIGNQWYVDSGAVELQRSLNAVYNRAYAQYKTGDNRRLRTATTSSTGYDRFGITRDGMTTENTTSATRAVAARNAWVADQSNAWLRAKIGVSRLVNAQGVPVPFWAVRAGDTVTIRDLPPTLGAEIDNIRTFRVGETDYNVSDNVLTITPDTPVPTLVTLTANRGRGG